MAHVEVRADVDIPVPEAEVYAVLADYRIHHPRIMPPSTFSDLTVEEGGIGSGTTFHITVRTAGRRRIIRMRVAEPEPGRILTETDLASGVVTTFTVRPDGAGGAAVVTMASSWEAAGLRGLIDQTITSRLMARIFRQQLDLLAAYAEAWHAAGSASMDPGQTSPAQGGTR